MKNFLVLLFIGILSCGQAPRITHIVVKKVDFDITSIISIGCDNFESAFDKQIDVVTINSKEELKQFQNFLTSIKSDSENYIPDVRAKLLIFYSDGSIDTLCLSDLGMTFNGKSLLVDQDIKQFVDKH